MSELTKFIAEFIGTFIFIGVILSTGEAIPIGLSLIVAILLIKKISGGHVNPAVSVMRFAKGDINITQLSSYVVAQVLGGICALLLYKHITNKET